MTHRAQILHIIDDATAGGVTRVVDFICTSQVLAQQADHRVHHIRRGRFRGVPQADVIVSHTAISWRTLPGLIALRASRPATPIVHVEHSYTAGFVAHNVTHKRRFMSLLKVAFSLFDRVVAVSQAQADWLVSRDLVPRERLAIIASCVDLSPFRALSAPKGDIETLGAIGRLDRQKGFDLLIDAFKGLPGDHLRLKIIGEGPDGPALQAQASPDSRIEFAGFHSDLAQALASVDAVVMPSRWEAFGLVAAEALAAGRPVLCSRVDGLLDHANDGASYIDGDGTTNFRHALVNLLKRCPADHVDVLQRGGSLRTEAFQQSWLCLFAQLCPNASFLKGSSQRALTVPCRTAKCQHMSKRSPIQIFKTNPKSSNQR